MTACASCRVSLTAKRRCLDNSSYNRPFWNAGTCNCKSFALSAADGARAAGIKPGIYYIVNNNILLSRVYNATPAQTEAVVLGQLREIWSGYGDRVELCAQHIPPIAFVSGPRPLLRLRR